LAKVVWTNEAERWLLKIHDYIARDKPEAAFNVVKSIYARAQVLEQFPRSGQSYRTKGGREARILMWGHYRIVYVQPTESEVHVVGVFHGAMELARYVK
jgi:plasmid stabilization system protein ParE